MKIQFTPFWKFYGTHEKGLVVLEFYFSKFTYLATKNFWNFDIVILSNRLSISQLWSTKK